MRRLFTQPIDEYLNRSPREMRVRVTCLYAGYGFLLGVALLTILFVVHHRIEHRTLEPLDLLADLVLTAPIAWFLGLIPFIFAALFARLGFVQASLRITNQQLEERVRERTMEITLEKARTNAIIDNAADGIVAFYDDGRICLFNSTAEKIFGYRFSEAIQRDIRTLVPAFEGVTDGRYLEFLRAEQAGRSPGAHSPFSGLRKDGTFFPIEIDISEYHLGDEVSYTAIIRDQTERRRQDRLERSLLELTEAVNQTQELDQLYVAILESLGQVIDVTNFYIALLNPDRETYSIVFCQDELYEKPDHPLPLEKSIVRVVIDAGKTQLFDSADFKRMVAEGKLRGGTGRPSVSWLGAPLISNGEPIGVMAVHSHEEGIYYTDRDLWVFNFVSGQIASAIERERAREQLRQSEKRYRRIVEEAGDIVYTTDLSGRFTYVNPPIIKLTGYTEAELIGEKSSILVDEEWRKNVRAFYVRQLRERTREAIHEFPIRTKAGNLRWLEQTTTLLFEKDRPVGFQAVVHDITDRRDVEWALREREERFRSLSASSPIGVFQVNPGGQCVYTNKRWQEITGRTLAESLGEGWLEALHPGDRQTFKIEWIFSRDEGSSAGREVRVLTKGEDVRWVSIRWASTFDDYNQLTGYVGTFEDITARKKTEAQNRVLYEISQAAITTDDLPAFFASLHHSLSQVVDTTNLYVALLNRESGTVSFPYARESGVDLNLAERPVGRGLTGLVIQSGRPLLVDETELDAMYSRGEVQPLGKPTKNWLGVPLLTREGVLGAVILQSYVSARHFSQSDVQTMTFVSSQIAAAIQRKRAEEERRRYTAELAEAHGRIKEDLRVAARIQQSRLPQEKLQVPGVEFGWLFNACEEVAGDMFNFVQLSPHHIGVYILDVSGHGVPAALLSMALSRSMTAAADGSGALLQLRSGKPEVASPAEVAETMNRRFPMNLEINQYFTFLYGVLDLRTNGFSFARAGHPAPILVRRGRARELDDALGPAIGILPEVTFEEATIQLEPGDEIIFYTDGIDEASNRDGEEFGLQRILTTLSSSSGGIEDSIQRLRDQVRDFTGSSTQSDDITIVGFRVLARGTDAEAVAG